eukprot:Skav233208  [mRNA]  locus=scaffold1872:96489:102356:+ [translate_table: standard]
MARSRAPLLKCLGQGRGPMAPLRMLPFLRSASGWASPGHGMSHDVALRAVRTMFGRPDSYSYILILEDDVQLPAEMDAGAFWSKLRETVNYLNAHHEQWTTLQLGAVPLLCKGGNKETRMDGLFSAGRAVQAHSILWKKTSQTEEVIQTVLAKLAAGQVADNAVMARHRFTASVCSFSPMDKEICDNGNIPRNL